MCEIVNSSKNVSSILCVQVPWYDVHILHCDFCVQNTQNV